MRRLAPAFVLFALVLGADGNDRNPDGVSIEIAGKVADHIVAVSGNAGAKGKAGTVKAPEGAVVVTGK